ncbi:MAG: OsmC family protein [Promethearchaeota archaeon]
MKVKLKWDENICFKGQTRNFSNIIIDEPEDFHGTNKGPSAVEYLAFGIGGCLGSSFMFCLKKMEVSIKDLEIILDVKLTHVDEGNGFTPLRIVNIIANLEVTLENNEDHDILDLCISSFKKYCSVTASVIKGIPVDVKVIKKDPS